MRVEISGFMLTAIAIATGFVGYYLYQSYEPASLYLAADLAGPFVASPSCSSCAWTVDNTILHVEFTISRIQLHQTGGPSGAGWLTLTKTTHPSTWSDSSPRSWTFGLSHGTYDGILFNITDIVVDIEGLGNTSYTAVGGGFLAPFQPGLQVQPNHESVLIIRFVLLDGEIHANNGPLHVVGVPDYTL